MEMEVEVEGRVKALGYKVKAMSRESPSQKAANVLDSDLRTHWSTATNTKEWILLELDESCLLSHIRIYNKSVLEWEITVGLRYKPEAFVKVRPRCEAPRRDMMYPINYVPCRYVRISCLRGNPIAIFFIQVLQDMTKSPAGLFFHNLRQILQISQMQLSSRYASLRCFQDHFIQFFILLKEREAAKASVDTSDSDAFKNNQTSTLTVSSNFEVQPRRSRSPSNLIQSTCSIAFRSDAIIMLLKKACKDSHLGIVCLTASRALHMLIQPNSYRDLSGPSNDLALSSNSDETAKCEVLSYPHLADYSSLFGEKFKITDDCSHVSYLNVLDIAAVEEGIIHVLYACASQPLLCSKLADSNSEFWSILPLVQALLPALRPPVNSPDQLDETFSQWNRSYVQLSLSQIVTMTSSSVYRPLLHACAGYLASFSSTHAKTACILIDLCSGPLSPWISTVISKVDLAVELMEDLLGIIQGASQSLGRARAALKYIVLALSGHMDDILAKYKENKLKLLFLLEMLEPFLDPAITATKSTISFGDVSAIFLEKQERTCAVVLNLIRTAAQRPAALPSLESEWRRGSVAPSVLLSVLGPHVPLPPEVDLCKCSVSKESCDASSGTSERTHEFSYKSTSAGEFDEKIDVSEPTIKLDASEDANLLFAPPELKKTVLITAANPFIGKGSDRNVESGNGTTKGKILPELFINHFQLDNGSFAEFCNLQADYLQLIDFHDSELRAAEFERLALDLCSQLDITLESHDAAIDALLLAAECYVNPFFMVSFRPSSNLMDQMITIQSRIRKDTDIMGLGRNTPENKNAQKNIAHVEAKRDKAVLQILIRAANLSKSYQTETQTHTSENELLPNDSDDRKHNISTNYVHLESADAVTLVRQNQELLCHFIMQQLLREHHSSHEILLQTLLFLLHSATELFCPPENVIDIILQSAENLNEILTSLYYQRSEGNMHFDFEKLHGAQRRWMLLQRLVLASSGSNGGRTDFISNRTNGFQFKCLVPYSSWIYKISKFSYSPYALPRFLGWMAVSRYAKQYLKEQLYFTSDLSQLTSLLTIFSDELAFVDNIAEKKVRESDLLQPCTNHYAEFNEEIVLSDQSRGKESFCAVYPDLHKFFPNLKEKFGTFGEIILEAVGLQLRCLSRSAVPDVLCWFCDLCMWPYSEAGNNHQAISKSGGSLKGYTSVNAKAIVLYLLESIVSEHMEVMVPEMPRVAQILISLSKASYCDVAFLDSVLRLLQPLISYFMRKTSDGGKLISNEFACLEFESSFEELIDSIKCRKASEDVPAEKKLRGSMMIFTLGAIFPDVSFRMKIEILGSLLEWVDFTASEPTSSFYDYLCAFQKVLDSCYILLVHTLNPFGILEAFRKTEVSDHTIGSLDVTPYVPFSFTSSTEIEEVDNSDALDLSGQGVYHLSRDDIKELSEALELLISKLVPSTEICWRLHYQLANKLTVKSAECFLFSGFLCSISQAGTVTGDGDDGNNSLSVSSDLLFTHWQNALKGLTELIISVQQNQCWQVASAMLDYVLRLPQSIALECVLNSVCSAIKLFFHAPRISWRLQTDKWLSCLFMRGIWNLDGNHETLVDLLSTMLEHWEPEQRSIALQHLGRIVCLDNNEVAKISNSFLNNSTPSDSSMYISESIIPLLVTSTWDKVAAVALSDPSMVLKSHAIALLSGYIPFVERYKLQPFLMASNTIMRSMGGPSLSVREGHITRLSLMLLTTACLYSPAEDIALIPESVWQNLENMGMLKTGWHDDGEKKLCQALCQLKAEPDSAKEALKDALLDSPASEQSDPKFRSTRESILQVISTLTSIQSYFDFFSKRTDQETQELEEAEIEIDLLQKEKALKEVSISLQEETLVGSNVSYDKEDGSRLQKIKNDIKSLERSKLREEIASRRQKKLLMRRARQNYLEEAASREMELLQEIDRERTIEVERTVERQRQLEIERAKTRELQFTLDMERERQTQRELQKELEQVEVGVRSSRRELPSNSNSRARERYRERDNINGRQGNEGNLRPSSRGHESGTSQTATTAGPTPSAAPPTVVLAGSRSFSDHLPTILQSRDRLDEHSTATYEDSFDGSRDSGDANSVGDPESSTTFDGLAGGFSSGSRHGSRGSKSRQIAERRERDGRREGKWERKHS